MAKKPTGPAKMPLNHDLLSEEDRLALSAEAAKSVLAEMTQDARDAYFASEMARLRREQIPADQLGLLTIDTAPFVAHLMIDGVQFFQGYTYEVPHKQRVVLLEQMQRSWHHQDEIDGRSRFNAYRRPQNHVLSPNDAGTVTRGVNGVVAAEI